MRTQPLVDLSLYDPTIKPDGTVTDPNSTAAAFSKVEDLEQAGPYQKLATFEPNGWLLDGSHTLLPDDTTDVHVGYFSEAVSDSDGDLPDPGNYDILVEFDSEHDLDGFTLTFPDGEWASYVIVDYRNSVGGVIKRGYYHPDSSEFYTALALTGVKSVYIYFVTTNLPYHHAKLKSIDYGKIVHFTGADIKDCRVIEEISPLCTELPIGTLDLTVHSDDEDFSIVDPTGDFFDLQNRQPLDVYEQVGADRLYIGHFFLDEWENLSATEIRFRAVDWIGVLDTMDFLGHDLNEAYPGDLESYLGVLLGDLNIPYSFDGDFGTEYVWGFLRAGSVRDALQCLLNSFGATAVCARSAVVHILPIPFPLTNPYGETLSTWDYALTVADKGVEQSLTLKPLVTGVEVTGWDSFDLTGSSTVQLFSGDRDPGTYILLFDTPTHVTAITGGTIEGDPPDVESFMYCVYTVAEAGTVTITGEIAAVNKHVVSLNNVVDSSVQPNIKQIRDNPAIKASPYLGVVVKASADAVASRLLVYYNMRYIQKMKAYQPPYSVGNSLLIDTQGGRQFWGVVNKMTLDLARGFVADVEAVGIIKAV